MTKQALYFKIQFSRITETAPGTVTDFRSAVDAAATQVGQPTLSPAINTFAQHSADMGAVERGANALRYAGAKKGTDLKP